MIFNTLGRYFFKRYARTTFWFLIGIFALIFIIDFSELTSRMSNLPHYTVSGALLMTTFRIPTILQQTVPFVALFAAMAALISLNRRYELVVTRAAGISVWQFLRPFVVGALIFGALAVVVINPLAAWGTKKAEALEAEWGSTRSAAANSIPWLRQIYDGTDTIIGARSVQNGGTELINVTVIHFDPQGAITLRQDAKSAKLEDGYWLLNGVVETEVGRLPRRMETAQLRTNLRPDFVQERLAKADSIQFFDLPRKIEVARSFGFSTNGLETQFHSLMSLPLLLVAMTLIAACVSLKFSRFNQSRSVILGGILSGFVLYVVTVLIKAFGSSGIVPPFVAAWLPVVVAMALGSTILLHQEDG
ncbi:LPS export ABC transporter permease LptG [Sinorhizobium medicae]|uniref:LPS export ABC transporter permease LptG n=2 Tax=Sinorhizobium medicae TaxID=110321 RepID=A0A508X7Q6_9HYPH|nr:LPS export ABC transporter permease LptG [Sinorhizobium medicae]ABR59620.1 permease YjgP/YjgQ family protein [Sinorhizobium medicae WSM419]MBO1939673.1 LPS export ABC transporter permease LptG [Sinorhizobium medicae]MBO1963096.1 LPS export ABC transporter permease LptG [Sinorhizobium medicae]MDX0404246.1 LPS export ABC transporter permease LptG [Sinorhizobium medicae]MDX0410184.1 LPS export ABC transporter permease LptG [Sinorhizobium medicae]